MVPAFCVCCSAGVGYGATYLDCENGPLSRALKRMVAFPTREEGLSQSWRGEPAKELWCKSVLRREENQKKGRLVRLPQILESIVESIGCEVALLENVDRWFSGRCTNFSHSGRHFKERRQSIS